MQKWEYCVITGVDFDTNCLRGDYPMLAFFSPLGMVRMEDLGSKAASKRPKGMEKVGEGGYIASVIARLGIEGWEMVSTVNGASGQGTDSHCIYFRRPIV